MNLFTLAEMRERLWRYAPVPKAPYSSATASQKDQMDFYINQVCERMLGRMKPRHTMRRVNVPVYNGTLTVPRELDGLDGIEMVDANNCPCTPLQIYSRFHEWARPAVNCCCSGIVFVLTDIAQTFKDPDPSTDGFKLRVKATEPTDSDMNFYGGRNADWDEISLSSTLTFSTGTDTLDVVYTVLPRIQKQVTTNYVELYSVDVATDEETLIAVYGPGETNPAYKRYRVPEWNNYPMARIFGKLAFIELTSDNDIVIPNNLGAMKAGLQALAYEDAADLTRSDQLWQRAISILDEDRAESEDAEMPNFRVDPEFGIGSIPQVI